MDQSTVENMAQTMLSMTTEPNSEAVVCCQAASLRRGAGVPAPVTYRLTWRPFGRVEALLVVGADADDARELTILQAGGHGAARTREWHVRHMEQLRVAVEREIEDLTGRSLVAV